jgi:transcriptional regulator with PAS, ATPase and Fis domain
MHSENLSRRPTGNANGQSDDAAEGDETILAPELVAFVQVAAASDDPVLLMGESGSGKTRLSRLIHAKSRRSGQRFVHVNCAAVPQELFAREMFGHVRGAFTDAKDGGAGLFEAAHGGSLCLDEIAEIPRAVQANLLAVVETGMIRRIGDTRERPVDVRLIAATNTKLSRFDAGGALRTDLYFRLAVLSAVVPPLRSRKADIRRLAQALLERIVGSGRRLTLDDAAVRKLTDYEWPGNLRELDSALRHAVAFGGRQCTISVESLPHWVSSANRNGTGADCDASKKLRYQRPNRREERRAVEEALRAENGNRTSAARRLGMSRSTLWVRIKEFGLDDA